MMKIAVPIALLVLIVSCSYYLYSYQPATAKSSPRPSATEIPAPTPVKTDGELAIEIYGLINKYRVEQGLESLTYSEQLRQSARMKSEDLFANDYWSHTSPDGKDPWYWVKKAGYQYQYAGENLSRDYAEPERIVEAWKQSKTHNENLLSKNYTQAGVYYHCESIPYTSCIAVMHYASPVNVLGAQTKRSTTTLTPTPTPQVVYVTPSPVNTVSCKDYTVDGKVSYDFGVTTVDECNKRLETYSNKIKQDIQTSLGNISETLKSTNDEVRKLIPSPTP